MQIIPLAAESMGVRSMCTHVSSGQCSILIDPGCALASYRYGLYPHPLEKYALNRSVDRIRNYASDSNCIIITHYHPAHFDAAAIELYRNKTVFIKNPNHHVTLEQRRQAFDFMKSIRSVAQVIHFADGLTRELEGSRFVFSEPVKHGGDTGAGYVLLVSIEDDTGKFCHAADVNGPEHNDVIPFLKEQNPDTLYIDGPVTYLPEQGQDEIDKRAGRIIEMLESTKTSRILVDHHTARDRLWKDKVSRLLSFCVDRGITVATAAEYRGEENQYLESRRDGLYREDPGES